jgi:hypothetical protein
VVKSRTNPRQLAGCKPPGGKDQAVDFAQIIQPLANWKSLTGPALQAALATAENHKQLGSMVLFHPTFEWGYRLSESSSLSIFYEHISNANTAAKNEGLDSLGLRYGYRF